MTPLEAALGYAARGRRVFPAVGKVPLTPRGVHDATSDPRGVRELFTAHPAANVGMAMGSGFWALDIDGPEGRASVVEIERRHGRLPITLTNITARGEHLIFTEPPDSAIRNRAGVLPGLDVRGPNGYIIVAPSRHPSGHLYTWRKAPIATPPRWLVDLVAPPEAQITPPSHWDPSATTSDDRFRKWAMAGLERLAHDVAMAPKGRRNDELNRCAFGAGRLVGAGFLRRNEVVAALSAAAVRCGLSRREACVVLREGGGLERGIANPSPGPNDRPDFQENLRARRRHA